MARLAPSPLVARPRVGASARLAEAVAARLARGAADGEQRIERVEVEAGETDALAWLAAQPHALKLYWHGRGTEVCVAGVGAAHHIAGPVEPALEALQSRLDLAPPAVRYTGGVRFDTARFGTARFGTAHPPSPEWAPFGAAWFVLPRVELTVSGERAALAAFLVLPRDACRADEVLAGVRAVCDAALPWDAALPVPSARADAPEEAGWSRNVEHALDAIAETPLEKVVLARRARLDFDAPLDPFALAHRLGEATPSCAHFLIQPSRTQPGPGPAFVGASPERLFRREQQQLWSEAVAGTRPRSPSASDDAALREELLRSDKEQREHGAVRDYLRGVLTPFCASLDLDAEASEMQLARGRHLYSGLRATLRPEVRTLDLLRALHPTPAVGGTPTDEALRLIRGLEPFDRGWYAGPVGWIGPEAAEFAVAIRSGLVEQREGGARLSLYAGAGIVRGSDPGAEWAETEHKLGPFLHLFGGGR